MQFGKQGRSVNIGIIGLGCRGFQQMKLLASMPDISIRVLCDIHEDRVFQSQEYLLKNNLPRADGTCNSAELLDREDIEAIIIMTSWETHIDLAVQAMRKGIKPAMEVGGAVSIEECWQLVHTSEVTGVPCMLLENCCYGREEMALLRMVRLGLFGELVHCQGGYQHDLREEIGNGDLNRHYRQQHFFNRNGELYPTHELGPIANYLNINNGNRMVSLVSTASKAAGMHSWFRENRHDLPEVLINQVNEGDIVNTIIKCSSGATILLTHDCTLPRPYSRGGRIQGTKGIWMEDNQSIFIDGISPVDSSYWTHRWESDKKYMEEYEHPLWKAYNSYGTQGGHNGMDYLVLRGFIEAIQQNRQFPIDVYNAATWMSITVLSEQSIAQGSMPVAIPDFTGGRWLLRKSVANTDYNYNL